MNLKNTSISMPSQETSFKITLVSTVELVTDMSTSKTVFDLIVSQFRQTSTAIFCSFSLSPFSGSGICL